jgi:hypothetical protein
MKTPRIGITVGACALVIAAAMAAAALNWAHGHFEWHPIYVWVMAPYLLCALILVLPWGVGRRRVTSGAATACGLLVFTYLFYVEGLIRSGSSAAPILVIFAPLYLIVGGSVFWALTYFLVPKLIAIEASHREAN